MLFASFDFLIFFLPVLGLFWLLRDRPMARTALLIGASYFFYMASPRPPAGSHLPAPWYFVGLLLVSTFLDYIASAKIHAAAEKLSHPLPEVQNSARRTRNAWLVTSLVGNLGLLGYFKYTNFFIEAFTDVANLFGLGIVAPHLDLLLPIGISFYTFQSLSYTIDVWRQRLTPEPNFAKFALFVVFFPQLVAGPIVRASEFLPQLHQRPSLTRADIEESLFRIFKGLAKKVILGDWIAAGFADLIFSTPDAYTSLEVLLALYAFTLQIYADFAGYSDIAIGVARLMGFKIPENFDRPYQARNLAEFWRKWHMTLSTWLRDYLFFPLGGSKVSPARTYFNLWLTMFLVGMWHGASWNFVIYSNLHGLAMLFNRWNRTKDREGGLLGQLAINAIAGAGLGGVVVLLGQHVLKLENFDAQVLGGFATLMFFIVASLPQKLEDGVADRFLMVFQVILTFHFTVLSRIFFRADSLDLARGLSAKIIHWDGKGVRPGLFRVQWFQDWVASELSTAPAPLQQGLHQVGEYLLLIVLVGGIAYHFTPRKWVDEHLKGLFTRLPGPVLGIAFALLGLLIMNLLDGPRANIYFEF